MQAVVIESAKTNSAGFMAEAATEHGYRLEQVVVDGSAQSFPDPEGIDLLLITGSEEHWYEIADHPHLQAELTFIQAAMNAGSRVLGMCFGGQALALALGAEVFDNGSREIGWIKVNTSDPNLISPGPWFAWHEDAFSLPQNARLLAWNEFGVQAFAHGRHLGLQFHPELTPEMLTGWAPDLPAQVDGEALMAETAGEAARARDRAFALFKMFESLGETR